MKFDKSQESAIAQSTSRRVSIVTGGAGCLSGDTIIGISRPGHKCVRDYTLEYAFCAFNHQRVQNTTGVKFWQKEVETSCRADIGIKLGVHQIDKIVYSGIRPVYLVEDDRGNTIKATLDHKFMNGIGKFVPLSTLSVGDEIMVRNPFAAKKKKRAKRRKIIESLKYHQVAESHRRHIVCKKKNWEGYYYYQRVHYARLVVEASMNNIHVDEFIHILKNDEDRAKKLKYLPSRMEVHHIDEDTLNDSLSNLKVLSKSDHTKNHCRTSSMQNQFSVKCISKIVKIEQAGYEPTYDIVMKDPYRNFIANNFIVHNSGKTTIIREITRRLESSGETVKLCAFAGKAAARIREACEHPASTIHRMLAFNGKQYMTETLETVSVVIDEASMIDAQLLAEIVKRNPRRLVLVGDPAQLPPVGRGAPFHNLIELKPGIVSELTTCYRATEAVFKAATAIRGGGRPAMSEESASEKWSIRNTGDAKQTHETILQWVRGGAFDFEKDAILVARNGTDTEPCTVNGLNRDIADIMSGGAVRTPKAKFVVGDRVINTKNLPELDCWNGTTGTIHAIDIDGGIWVRTDIPVIDKSRTRDADNPEYTSLVMFGKDVRKHLQLAYALTVHKSQGSEYRNVLMCCLNRDAHTLLDRALLYTGVTRTRGACVVVGEVGAVWGAIDRVSNKRTVMQELARQ